MPTFGQAVRLNQIPVVGIVPETSAGAPANPRDGQLWVDTTGTKPKLKVWDAEYGDWTRWDFAKTHAAGSVGTAELADASVTPAKVSGLTAAVITDFTTAVRAITLDQFAVPVAAVALNGQRLTGLATPTDAGDAATKGYVDTSVSDLVNAAPATLDTLKELAYALGDDANFATTVATRIGTVEGRVTTLEGRKRGYAQTLGAVAAGGTVVVNHEQGTEDVIVQVRNTATRDLEYVGVNITDANTVTISADIAYGANALRVVVLPVT